MHLAALAPGNYELGDSADCIETVEVRAMRAQVVTVRRDCVVQCSELVCRNEALIPPG